MNPFIDFDPVANYRRLKMHFDDFMADPCNDRMLALLLPLRLWVEMKSYVEKDAETHGISKNLSGGARWNKAIHKALNVLPGWCVLVKEGIVFGKFKHGSIVRLNGNLDIDLLRKLQSLNDGNHWIHWESVSLVEWFSQPIVAYSIQADKNRHCRKNFISREEMVGQLANAFQAVHSGLTPLPPSALTPRKLEHKEIVEKMVIERIVRVDDGFAYEGEEMCKFPSTTDKIAGLTLFMVHKPTNRTAVQPPAEPIQFSLTTAHRATAVMAQDLLSAFAPLYGQ